MPISHLTFRCGQSPSWQEAVTTGLQQVLEQTFAVPPGDCFQVLHEVAAHQLRYDRHYLTSERGANWLLIEITAGKPRSLETKRTFYRALAARLAHDPGLAPADLMVVIRHNQAEDWSFGLGRMSMLPDEEGISC